MTAQEQQQAQLSQFEAGARLAESELTLCRAQFETFKKFEHLERKLWRSMVDSRSLPLDLEELADKFLEAQKSHSQATLAILELTLKKMESQKQVFQAAIEQIKNAPLVEIPGQGAKRLHVPGA